jgi:hypothetical protein
MTLQRTLSNPTVVINDVTIGIKPNSLMFKDGKGTRTVRAQSGGGSSIVIIVTEDASTKLSEVTFILANTEQNIGYKRDWQGLDDGSVISLVDGGFNTVFNEMVVTDDPEVNLGAEGEITVKFQGLPVL